MEERMGQNMKDRDADLLIDEEEEEKEERGESKKETTEGLTGSGFYRQPENGRETQQMEVMRSRALGGNHRCKAACSGRATVSRCGFSLSPMDGNIRGPGNCSPMRPSGNNVIHY